MDTIPKEIHQLMRKILRALLALTITTTATLAVATPAHAADPVVLVGTVTSAPDNGTPPWARDDLTITTTISETDTDGAYAIRQDIDGTWTSTSNPDLTGTVTGFIEYTITGTLLDDPTTVDDDADLSWQTVKASPSTVATWALRYFADAQAGPSTAWEYTYASKCEDPFTEPTDGDVGADTFTEVCPEPEPTPTPTATPEPTGEPSPSPEPTAAPTPATTTASPTLPVTGPSVSTLVGVGLAAFGLGVIVLFVARLTGRRNGASS